MTGPVFPTLLGAALERLPAPVRRLHSLAAPCDTAGLANVVVAPGLLPPLICRIAGLPPAGTDVPATVRFTPEAASEYWERRFADRSYASRIAAGSGRDAGLLVERFGPFRLAYALTPDEQGLGWRLVRWRLLAVPLPGWTLPLVQCRESAEGARYRFDIDFALPLVGPVIRYRGWLEPLDPR